MIDWLQRIIHACTSIFQTSINVGSGYSISLWNVFVFGVVAYLLLRIVFDIIN